MASSEKYPLSQLNKWRLTDKPHMDDYNADNRLLDENAMWKATYDPQAKLRDVFTEASTAQLGIVQLSDALDSDSSATAATSKAVKDALDEVNALLEAMPLGSLPVGSILPFAGAHIPAGWLLCNGTAVSRSAYAALFNAVGTAYGAGDGSSTFGLPDLRGRFPLGSSEAYAQAGKGGAASHTLTTAEMPAHIHQGQAGGALISNLATGANFVIAAKGSGPDTFFLDKYNTTAASGNGAPHNNMPPYLVLNYIIKYSVYSEDTTQLKEEILDAMYPVGSIYFSAIPDDPALKFGGTWVAWGAGKVPVGIDTAQTEFNAAEKTGGAKTEALTAAQMPAHTHPIPALSGTTASGGAHTHSMPFFASANPTNVRSISPAGYQDTGNYDYTYVFTTGPANAPTHTHTFSTAATATQNVGSGTAHNNLPPYITCYMWKRTA